MTMTMVNSTRDVNRYIYIAIKLFRLGCIHILSAQNYIIKEMHIHESSAALS